jgi:hypothetical protein
MQYNKTKEGTFEPLKQKNVDTGMGLERILVALNGGSVFDTDLYSDGGSLSHFKLQNKQLVLNGYVKTDRAEDILFINKLLGSKSKKTLLVDVDGLGVVSIEVYPTNFITDDKGFKSCQLIAYDPYMYSTETTKVEVGRISKNYGFEFPFSFPMTFRYGETGSTSSIYNNGNTICYPVITIKGTCSHISFYNNSTNEYFNINTDLGANDVLIIDNRPKTRGVYLNGINRIDLKSGNWIKCIEGENVLAFYCNTLETDKKHCTVEIVSRWI